MQFTFYKYHGTGNDFVLIDDRALRFPASTKTVASICHRRFGIGADGLILLQDDAQHDFKMVYFNSDGNQSSMCGNGGRCIVKFAHDLGLIKNSASFMAIDGVHAATLNQGEVSLKMIDTPKAIASHGHWFVDTGSPHHVQHVEALNSYDVFNNGRTTRQAYGEAGSNINFVEVQGKVLNVRTYERGVENETYSCGTGVTAAAIVATQQNWIDSNPISIKTPGGDLSVSLAPTENGYENIWLTGPATFVFKGELSI